MEREDDQELWDFLGRTAEPRLSPFFARNVLRKIRQGASRFGLVIGMAIATRHPVPQKSPESAPDVVAKIDPQDYDVVADLDELIAWDENSLWDEKPSL